MSESDGIVDYAETPVFQDIETASFSFAFELYPDRWQRQALRIDALDEELDGDVRDALIAPLSTYLDDVTTGPPGRHGRPLIFLALPPGENERVRISRDASWVYEAEGCSKRLAVEADRRKFDFGLRDAFCAFKSGRLFYILSLTLPEVAGQKIDEYLVIHLQRQAMGLGEDDGLRFRYAGEDHSLLELARARLRALSKPTSGPNGVRDIIQDKLLTATEVRGLADAILLRGQCVAIEDRKLMQMASWAIWHYGHCDRTAEDGKAPARPETRREDGSASPANHNPATDPELFALAGLTQGVIDFPAQDPSELSDATCPASYAPDRYVVYAHPCFLLEVADDWRVLRSCRDSVGSCPYFMQTWLAAIHDHLLVSGLEDGIDEMVYLPDSVRGTRGSARFRANPFSDLHEALEEADKLFAPSGQQLLANNVERRLALVGTVLMHRSNNMFRYPKEKADLEATLTVMGTAARFERAQLLIEQIEKLVEDVTSLRRGYAERRTNWMLVAIALLSILSVSNDVYGHVWRWGSHPKFLAIAAALLSLAALSGLLLRLVGRRRRLSRLRKAGP